MTDPTDTKKLRELLALATTRPWKANTADKTGEDWLIGSLGNSNEDGQDWIVTTDRVRASELDGDAKFDAALIVAAVNALPALLDELEALRAERDRMREALEDRNTLLLNMMRGTVPKIHAGSLHKLYTEDELLSAARDAALTARKETP